MGGNLNLTGGKDFDYLGAKHHKLYFAPTIEYFALNKPKYGLSLKGAVNIRISRNSQDFDEDISAYMLGPKFSFNITPNISTYLWYAYRRLDDFDHTSGHRILIPSNNMDLRWGFSFYLNRKEKQIEN